MGLSPTQISENVDLADPKDARMVNRLLRQQGGRMKKRWATDDAFRLKMKNAVDAALNVGDPEVTLQAVKLGLAMEKQNQDDEHVREKYERLDNGQAVGDVVLKIEAPRVLGQPTKVTPEMEKELGLNTDAERDTIQPADNEGSGSD